MKRAGILLLAMFYSCAAAAQIHPLLVGGDPHIQLVDYQPDELVRIEGTPGYQITIELAPDEQIQSIAVGDSMAWQVTANRNGGRLFIKPTEAGVDTNMTVITNSRVYSFALTSQDSSAAVTPYRVRFRYPAERSFPGGLQQAGTPVGFYHLSGAQTFRPVRMSDDGNKTYIDWAPDIALPAAFIIDERGRESLANGNMRDGIYVIDGVYRHLLFRIDRQMVHAKRYVPKKSKP